MAGQPYDLTVRPQTQFDPAAALTQGLQLGQGLVEARRGDIAFQQAQDDRAAALAQQKTAAEQNAAMQAELTALSKAPSTQAITAFSIKYPGMGEKLKGAYDALSAEEQATQLELGSRAYAAVRSGQPEVAADILEEASAAMAADPARAQQAKALKAQADLLRKSPGAADTMMGVFLSAAMGPEKFRETFESFEKAPEAKRQAIANAKKAEVEADLSYESGLAKIGLDKEQAKKLSEDTKIAWARLALDRKKFEEEVAARKAKANDLQGPVAEAYNKAVIASVGAQQSADQTAALSTKFRQLNEGNPVIEFLNTGLNGRAGSWIANTFGLEDEIEALRKQYKATINADVLKNLPPGAASDRDIAIVREAFETEFADFGQLANALDAMGRIQRASAVNADAQAEWLRQNKDLTPAKGPVTVGGMTFAPGTSYGQAVKMLQGASKAPAADKAVEDMTEEEIRAELGGG